MSSTTRPNDFAGCLTTIVALCLLSGVFVFPICYRAAQHIIECNTKAAK